ncbi:Crp/Fnr family transcriptional regulator [Pseudomonadota bacterium]
MQLTIIDSKHNCCGCLLAKGLTDEQCQQLSMVVHTKRRYQRGEKVYRVADAFKSVYLVQQGSIKTEATTYDGRAVVTGFYFPGDIFGLDGLEGEGYLCDAVAIEDALVCEVPFKSLTKLCSSVEGIQDRLFMLLGQRIGSHDHTLIMMHNMSAESRLCRFLTIYHERMKKYLVNQGAVMILPMNKDDIARYLGISPETLSRMLTRLVDKGVIRKHARKLELLDIDTLYEMAC